MSDPAFQSLNLFKSYFEQLDSSNIESLKDIYTPDISFQDPLHRINGLKDLERYFSKLNSNLVSGRFRFTNEYRMENSAILEWEMTIVTKQPKASIMAQGISVLTLKENKIIIQRDYFDAGEVFYENIPILRGVIRFLKRKLRHSLK